MKKIKLCKTDQEKVNHYFTLESRITADNKKLKALKTAQAEIINHFHHKFKTKLNDNNTLSTIVNKRTVKFTEWSRNSISYSKVYKTIYDNVTQRVKTIMDNTIINFTNNKNYLKIKKEI